MASPYIVIMNGNPVNAASYAQNAADAISNYTGGTPGVATLWPTYEASIESYWAAMGATGAPCPDCHDRMGSSGDCPEIGGMMT